MEIKEIAKPSGTRLTNEVEILDSQTIDGKTITTKTPILIYDALGTIVTLCDPLKQLRTKEEIAMYTLSSLKTYNPKNEEILKRLIIEMGLVDVANVVCDNLAARGLNSQATFYALADIMAEEYCKKNGDLKQEMRRDVLLKMHKLAEPRIFDQINEYSQRTFGSDISQLILTQDNSIMKEVYSQMLAGRDLEIIAVPDVRFKKLRKNNPLLYTELANYLTRTPKNIGFYDDNQDNLNAAAKIDILTQLATGVKNDDPAIIKAEASDLVRRLFTERQHRSLDSNKKSGNADIVI